MKTLTKLRIDYCYQNWGKMEVIICEQDMPNANTFFLFRHGQNVGTITKEGKRWKSGNNNIFLPSDIIKIGLFIDNYLSGQKSQVHRLPMSK